MADAGALDQRVTFQTRSATSDGMGGSSPQWANFASVPTVWARVMARSNREQFEGERNNATMQVHVTIRYRDDITEADRMLWNGEAYNIRGIMREGSRPLYLKFIAERGVTSGN